MDERTFEEARATVAAAAAAVDVVEGRCPTRAVAPASDGMDDDGGNTGATTTTFMAYQAPPPHRIFFAVQPDEQLLGGGMGGDDTTASGDNGDGSTTTTLRPQRLVLLHALVASLGLHKHLSFVRTQPATPQDLLSFHTLAYVEHLRQSATICSLLAAAAVASPTSSVQPPCEDDGDKGRCDGTTMGRGVDDGTGDLDPCVLGMLRDFNVDPPHMRNDSDCPLFPTLWDFVAAYTGATLACAQALVQGAADVAVNWSGGMHHAGPSRASGFCYVNDVVLAIHRLLERFHRVLYVDLDVHHGDGVEHAFAYNPRVCTLSIHQYGSRFFPGTGSSEDVGNGEGHGYAVNIPLPQRVGDATYTALVAMALSGVAAAFDPDAVVVQCGADTIVGDLIGRLCVTTHGHAACLARVMALHCPTLVLGGGGYHIFHTARCWAIHTAVVCGRQSTLPHCIPTRDTYYEAYRKEDPWREPPLHVVLHPAIDDPLPHNVDGRPMLMSLSRRLAVQLQRMRRMRWLSYGSLLKEAGAALGVVVVAPPVVQTRRMPSNSPTQEDAQDGRAAEKKKRKRRRW